MQFGSESALDTYGEILASLGFYYEATLEKFKALRELENQPENSPSRKRNIEEICGTFVSPIIKTAIDEYKGIVENKGQSSESDEGQTWLSEIDFRLGRLYYIRAVSEAKFCNKDKFEDRESEVWNRIEEDIKNSVNLFNAHVEAKADNKLMRQNSIKPIIGLALTEGFIADKKINIADNTKHDIRKNYRDALGQLEYNLEVIRNDFPYEYLLTDIIMNNLAWSYTYKGDNKRVEALEWDNAIDLAKRATMNNSWKDAIFLDTLAMAYFNKGLAVSNKDQRNQIFKTGALFIEMAKDIDQNNTEIHSHCMEYKKAFENDKLGDIDCLPKK